MKVHVKLKRRGNIFRHQFPKAEFAGAGRRSKLSRLAFPWSLVVGRRDGVAVSCRRSPTTAQNSQPPRSYQVAAAVVPCRRWSFPEIQPAVAVEHRRPMVPGRRSEAHPACCHRPYVVSSQTFGGGTRPWCYPAPALGQEDRSSKMSRFRPRRGGGAAPAGRPAAPQDCPGRAEGGQRPPLPPAEGGVPLARSTHKVAFAPCRK